MIPSYHAIIQARAKLLLDGAEITIEAIQHEIGPQYYTPAVASRLNDVEGRMRYTAYHFASMEGLGPKESLVNVRSMLAGFTHTELQDELERMIMYVVPEMQLRNSILKKQSCANDTTINSFEQDHIKSELSILPNSGSKRLSAESTSSFGSESERDFLNYSCTNCGLVLEISCCPELSFLALPPTELQQKVGYYALELFRQKQFSEQLGKKVIKHLREIAELRNRLKTLDDIVYSLRDLLRDSPDFPRDF
jgi:hypothetical protein